MAVNASRKRTFVVSSMRLIASVVCAIESIRSLRCVVRKTWRVSSSSNCSIAIMLTGPSRSILSLRRSIASSAVIDARRAVRRRRAAPARLPPASTSPSSASGSGSSAAIAAASGVGLAGLLHLLDVDQHLVERALHGVDAGLRQVAEVAFGGGPRHLELAGLGCGSASSARRASRMTDVLRVDAHADVRGGLVGGRAGRSRSPSSAAMSSSSVRSPSAIGGQQRLAAGMRLLELGRPRRHAKLELARALLEPLDFGGERRRPLDQRGMARRALRPP